MGYGVWGIYMYMYVSTGFLSGLDTVPSPAKPGVKKKRSVPDVTCGAPFRPDCVYDLLHKIHTSLSTKVGVVSGCGL